jgi:hypothetical protein
MNDRRKSGLSARFRRLTVFLPLLAALMSVGCTGARSTEIRVAGAGDLYYLSTVLNQQYLGNSGVTGVAMTLSDNATRDLKRGKADAALLGREPAPAELDGLRDYVIAYDAVCVILDETSYKGGISGSADRPSKKTTGLRNMSSANLTLVFSSGWSMEEGFFRANRGLDPNSWLWKLDSAVWVPEPVPLQTAFVFPKGKFDTQTVLYSRLGLDEGRLLAGRTSFTQSRYKAEEEVLSFEYNLSIYGQASGIQDFPFKLAFASRRVMTVAPKHVAVRALAIDGIDPMTDTQSIYDGAYPLSRKIHILVRENGPARAVELADSLVSAEGQEMLTGAGYLPVRPRAS